MGFARDLCQNCRLCTAVCPSKALFVDGETLDIEEIMRRVLLDADIIREGGGVTLSGGEPFMRPQAAAALLSRCHEIKLHTAVETCGFFDLDDNYLRTALGDTDVLYYDIKQMDCVKHKQGTDLDNERILHNLKRIGLEFPDLTVVTRTAIIPGFNDTVQDFLAIAHFVKSVKNVQRHEILNFNTYCSEKYIQMGLPVPISLSYKTNMNLIQECVKIGENVGLQVEVLL
jgi:pyruvate formate lyase activating enzyme